MTRRYKNEANAVVQIAAYEKFRKKDSARADSPVFSKASRHVSGIAKCQSLQPLGAPEIASLHTLFGWVANEQGFAEETVAAVTEAHFGVSHVGGLKQKDYDEVVKFLVDLRIDEMCN